MARIEVSGLDALISGLEDMANQTLHLSDDILDAEADVVEPALRRSVADERLVRTSKLMESIGRRRLTSGGVPVVRIGPIGEHHRYAPTSGKSGVVSAGYIGYIGEYGIKSRGIPGKAWLKKGVEKSQGKTFDAADAVYDKYMKKNNL